MVLQTEKSSRDAFGFPLGWRGSEITLFDTYNIVDTALHVATPILDCRPANKVAVELTATFVGTPTSFEVIALFRRTGETAWQEYRMGEWNFLTYSKAEIDAITAPDADTLREVLTVEAVGDEFCLALRGTGTTAIALFRVTAIASPVNI